VTEAAAPAVATEPATGKPTVVPPKLDTREQLFRELVETLKRGQEVQALALEQQSQLLKEHTQAVLANTRAMEDLHLAIYGEEPSVETPDGVDGLMDTMAKLDETMENVDVRATGLNMQLARYSFGLDRMGEIQVGSPDAPELEINKDAEYGKVYREGRFPTFKDFIMAIKEFDNLAEKEALAELEAEEKRAKEEAEERAKLAAPAAPQKPSMMGNKPKPAPPVFRPLPPAAPK
jgi:hypothetical protein